ncbi:MAG: 6-phosphogluconolactonase [Conchiformibius sp.]|nr:6-phosphogluconolactonase [Conchiformibius sp.]
MTVFHTFADAPAAAAALADAVSGSLRDVLAQQPEATLAVSGGRSPVAFFHALRQTDLDWARVNITLADERIVPVGHPDSNTALVRQHLLQERAAAARWLPLIDENAGSLNDTAAVLDFALRHHRQPDVLVLGMGADGHTASLFPQAPQLAAALADNAPPLAHTSPVTAPHERLTLTLPALCRSRNVYLAIAGADKLAVYRQAAAAVQAQYPVSHILHSEKVSPHVFYHD